MKKETGPTKQTAETARIAKRIRTLRSRGETWESSARATGILKENGDPDPGLAYRIALEGYEPKRPEVRERLGLRKVCLACMRGFRNVAGAAISLSPWRVWWRKLEPGERDRRIRENYEKENR